MYFSPFLSDSISTVGLLSSISRIFSTVQILLLFSVELKPSPDQYMEHFCNDFHSFFSTSLIYISFFKHSFPNLPLSHLLAESLSVSNAPLIALKAPSALGALFLSGWNFNASFLYEMRYEKYLIANGPIKKWRIYGVIG